MIGLNKDEFICDSKQHKYRLPVLRSNQTQYHRIKKDKNTQQKMHLQPLFFNMRSDLDQSQCQERLNQSLESINQLMEKPQAKAIKELFKLDKLKSFNADSYNLTLEQAEQCFRSPAKKTQQKAIAAKIIAEESLKFVYGGQLPKIEGEVYHRVGRKYKNRLNTKILSQILNQIEHSSRSHSIVIRKSQLQQIQAQYNRMKDKKSKFAVIKRNTGEMSEEQRMQLLYQLKNQYQLLKDYIIVSKSQQYEQFVSKFQKYERDKEVRKTHKMNNLKGSNLKSMRMKDKQNKQTAKYIETCKSLALTDKNKFNKVVKPQQNKLKGKFQLTKDRLVLEKITGLSDSAFLFMMTQCHFDKLKTVKVKLMNIESELIYFMLDCMQHLGSSENKMDLIEIVNVRVQNIYKLAQKLASLFAVQPVRVIKLELMVLNNRQLLKITQALYQSQILNQLSLRSNKIDILGVRYIQNLCKKVPSIESVDLRMNQIPHYANLKDKSSVIKFF